MTEVRRNSNSSHFWLHPRHTPKIICESEDWTQIMFKFSKWGEGQIPETIQFSCSLVSHSWRPHEPQHARPPCPSPTDGVYPNACPLSRWCHPIISSSLVPFSFCPQSFPESESFSIESVLCIRWPKDWSFSFSISPSNEYSGLISFSMDWLDLLAVQGTLKSLLQHHSSKASILRLSAFFIVQHSYPYMTTGETIALTRWPLLAK